MVRKCSALTKTLSPTLKSGAGAQRDLDSVSELQLSGFGVLGAVRLSPLRILWRARRRDRAPDVP